MTANREQLVRWCAASARFADELLQAMGSFEINTISRQAHFLAQVAHESGGFRAVVENLNYSLDSLRRVFPRYFKTDPDAAAYARQPEKIANRVYADRLGNGPEESGDGWWFRGRGLIQITGKTNYRACSVALFADDRLVKSPQLLEQPRFACESAAWFWNSRQLNQLADTDGRTEAIVAITQKINGGLNGIEDRREWLTRTQLALTAPAPDKRPALT